MKEISIYKYRLGATITMFFLESHNIEAKLANENNNDVPVIVPSDQYERAKALLNERDKRIKAILY